jgi:DNA/RNA endonuclease YhcR with UshA esterase domain
MNKLIFNFLALTFFLGFSSCLKENFDAPPTGGTDPNIDVNFTIDLLKQRYTGTNYFINEDLVIKAIVTADDKSGSFYKQIVIQDSTGGITLLLDGSSIFNDYPIGRRIFIKLKGLFLVQYKGLYQIAGSIAPDGSFNGIPVSLFDRFILKGTYFHEVAPKVVTISQLNDSYQSELIELDHVEFQTSDAGQPFADGFNKQSVARVVKNCSGGSLETYNSGYSNFANHLTPTGNGKLLAIYSVYNVTGQLLLRDESDLKMDSVRCGGGTGGGNGIMGIRNLWGGGDVVIPSGKTISGIVISDAANGNTDPKNMIIQDSTGGIVIRFTATHSFLAGDVVTVNLAGLTLTSYNGLFEVTNVPSGNATKTGTGIVTPRIATAADIQANGDAWESTLLTIQNATIGGTGTTYSGTKTLTDGGGTLNHYTRTTATFSASTLPSGAKSFTGILGDFNGFQLSIRSLADVQ